MKKSFLRLICFMLSTILLLLVSCGEGKGHFKIEGRFLHLNQGEFYVYSPDGAIEGMDTIKVEGGRFAYEIPCEKKGTLMLVFPNFSQQPIFAESGEKVEINADASHLKGMEVEGTDDNELMTNFGKQISNASPPEMCKYAEQFIKDHPESYVCTYLIRNFFIENSIPDYTKAQHLIDIVQGKQPQNGYLARLKKSVLNLSALEKGKTLPMFSDMDTKGNIVASTSLVHAPVLVISVWSTWNFESQNIQRQLKKYYKGENSKIRIIGICIDASKKECQNVLRRDSILWPNICDGNMFEGKTIKKLGITSVPDNILLQNGRVVAHGLLMNEIQEKLDHSTK